MLHVEGTAYMKQHKSKKPTLPHLIAKLSCVSSAVARRFHLLLAISVHAADVSQANLVAHHSLL